MTSQQSPWPSAPSGMWTLLTAVVGLGATLGCLGGGHVEHQSCQCSLELPTGWRSYDEDDTRIYATNLTQTTWVGVEFIAKDQMDGPSSAAVLLDSKLLDGFELPSKLATPIQLDERLAVERTFADRWAAMIPYDDGWIFVQAWTEQDNPDSVDVAVDIGRSVKRITSVIPRLPANLEPLDMIDGSLKRTGPGAFGRESGV